MNASKTEQPVIFALQGERKHVVPNSLVASYEDKLGAELGVAREDVHLSSAGTTTPSADSKED